MLSETRSLNEVLDFIEALFPDRPIQLHAPTFLGNEEAYVVNCIRTTMVSSVGAYVDELARLICQFTGARRAVAVVNGTQALFLALHLVGAGEDHEVLTQALTFVATANAITYTGARPVFIDVDEESLGMCPDALKLWLEKNTKTTGGFLTNRLTGRRVGAVVPMHTLGHIGRVREIRAICDEYGLLMIEDAAESLGSFAEGAQHSGTFGVLGTLSFNGNKIITTGGGGALITDSEKLADLAKHLSTTAKLGHAYEFKHDHIAYNFRLPNLNAALGCAQMERMDVILEAQRALADRYARFFSGRDDLRFMREPAGTRSNYWLNAIRLNSRNQRDDFLQRANARGIQTRPLWVPMHHLDMYRGDQRGPLGRTEAAYEEIVCLPSCVRA